MLSILQLEELSLFLHVENMTPEDEKKKNLIQLLQHYRFWNIVINNCNIN